MTRTSATSDIVLVGNEPAVFSTSTGLEVWPSIVWDTNAYYASLKVRFTASRTELRDAYMRLNGSSSARLTYILKQLLDAETRRRYDATPLGSIFVDEYILSEVQSIINRQNRMRHELGLPTLLDFDELIGDTVSSEPKHTQNQTHTQHTPHTQQQWRYGYYLKGDYRFQALRFRMGEQHRGVLRDWQTMLVAACASRGLRMMMGVGLSAHDEGVRVTRVGSYPIVFLSADQAPSAELASAIATILMENK